ncbi:MAG: tol-pal system protein YbgF [Rickettsiales bacterium]
MQRFMLSCACLLAFATPALAQDAHRLDRLERDLQMLQKEVYRNGVPEGVGIPASDDAALARAQVMVSQIEERLRNLEGRLEKLEFENRRLREQLDVFQQDVQTQLQNAPAPSQPKTAEKTAQTEETPAVKPTPPKEVKDTTQPLRLPSQQKEGEFSTSRDHYNHAFRLLQQTKYDEASKAFENFIQSYPGDPLMGNAYYWAGETHYVRRDFIQAADYFRQGFEAMPQGPKAGDNLLKLALSLDEIDRKDEACVVLGQVVAKFGANSVSLKKKASEERSRIGCK